MIYTVTFNPSIDYVVKVENFTVAIVNRVVEENKYAGGKGINVSRVLNNLGTKSRVLGFIGGVTGKFIESFLQKEGIYTDFIQVSEDTRINVKLISNEETEINGSGPNIGEEDLNKLFEKIDALNSEDILVLAGNVQKSLQRNIYSQIQEKIKDKEVKVIVDTTGEALISTLKYKPFLIKPNNYELGEIFNVEIHKKEDIIKYSQKLRDMGAQNVIISMASEGAVLVCDAGVYYACAPKGIVKNSVGAGDSLIAGFLASYSKTQDINEAFKYGVASGSATTFSMDLCKRDEVEKLFSQVKITKLFS